MEKVNQVLRLSINSPKIHQMSLIKVLRLKLLPEAIKAWRKAYEVQADNCHKLTKEMVCTLLFLVNQVNESDRYSPLGTLFHDCSQNVVIMQSLTECLDDLLSAARMKWTNGFSSHDKDYCLKFIQGMITTLMMYPEWLEFWVPNSKYNIYHFSMFLLNKTDVSCEILDNLFSLSNNKKCFQIFDCNYHDVTNWITKEYLKRQDLAGSPMVNLVVKISLTSQRDYAMKIVEEFIQTCFDPIKLESLINLLMYLIKDNYHKSNILESCIASYLMLNEFNDALSLFMTSIPQHVLTFARIILKIQPSSLVEFFFLDKEDKDSQDSISSSILLENLSVRALSMSKMIRSESQTYMEDLLNTYISRMSNSHVPSTNISYSLDLTKDLPQFVFAQLTRFFCNTREMNSILLDVVSEMLIHFQPKINLSGELLAIVDFLTECFESYLDVIPDERAVLAQGIIKTPPEFSYFTNMLVDATTLNYDTLMQNITFFPYFTLRIFVSCKTRIIYLS